MEAFNARIHEPLLNERAERYARNAGLPLGAGSDAHTLGEVGRAYVTVPEFADDAASFLAALRHSVPHGKASSRFVHLASTWAKVRKRVRPRPATESAEGAP
jgi:predicted metal-dependent phosphoesterase TrpH